MFKYFGVQAAAQKISALLTATGSMHEMLLTNLGWQPTGMAYSYSGVQDVQLW